MLCPRCGSDLPEGSKVCRFCKDIPVDSLTFSEPLSSTPALTPKLTPEVQPTSLGAPQKDKSVRAARRRVLPAVIVAVLVAAAGVGFSLLDKCGGTQGWQATLVLEAESTAQQQVTPDKLQQCVEVIKERLADSLVFADFAVATGEDDTIVVSLARSADVAKAMGAVLQQGRVGFYDVAEFGTAYASELEALAAAGAGSAEALPYGTSLIVWPAEEYGSASGTDEYYLVTAPAAVTGEMLKEAGWDMQGADGAYRITLEFNDEGAAAFAEITGELAEIGALTGELQQLAIVLDGVVQSAPNVHERIEGGSAEITGKFTLEEVKSIALALQNGALPLELTLRP